MLDGSEPACKWVRLAVERQARDLQRDDPRLYYDRGLAQSVLDKIAALHHIKGPLSRAGEHLTLQPWQLWKLSVIYGWRRWTQDARDIGGIRFKDRERWPRRYRKTYEEIARKNGKSTELAARALNALGGEGEPGAEVYSVATAKDQARIVFDAARAMARRIEETPFTNYAHSLAHLPSESFFRPLASDHDTLDGLSTYFCAVDELHAHKTRDVLDVMETSTGARLGALISIITTAGMDINGVCRLERAYVCQILERVIEDDTVFGLIFTAEEHADADDVLTNPDIWRLANPNLGVSVSLTDFEAQAAKAAAQPAALPNFKRKKLNIWTAADAAWINPAEWQAAEREPEIPKGTPWFIGLDLSRVRDLTAWAADRKSVV